MSMDPSGTNQILNQRIGEWYAERDGDRLARNLDGPRTAAPRSSRRRHFAAALTVALAGLAALPRRIRSRGVA